MKAIKVLLAGGLAGVGTGASFVLMHNLLTGDQLFTGWEFAAALVPAGVIAIIIALAARVNIAIMLAVAYLTFMLPIFGAALGSGEALQVWGFALMGLVGGLVWSVPFALWAMWTTFRGRRVAA